MDIVEYSEQLKQLCAICKSEKRCKDHSKICVLKKYAWKLAKRRYEKRGAINNGSI